ncbi:MAG TPA: hypothetical protein VMB79_00040 [Jatrophihabitans sp.]|nr:hypothetical protein [Jatrophihabitans sp.]
MARVTRRAAWPTLSLTLLALLGVLGVLLLTGGHRSDRGAFSVRTQPSVIALTVGDGAEFTVTLTAQDGFAGTVTLASAPLPAGVELTFDQWALTLSAGQRVAVATGRLRTTSAAAAGAAGIQVIARAGGTSQTSVVQLQLQPADLTNPAAPPPPTTGPGSASFTVFGNLRGALAPGASLPIDLHLVNGNPFELRVDSLTVAVASTSSAACRPENFAVVQYRGGYPVRVAAGTSTSLSALRVPAAAWPQLRMLDLPSNQDACKGVTVNLRYAGTGSGA